MKRITSLLSVFLLALCSSSAQTLLPLPQKVVWHKGYFQTDRYFEMEQDSELAAPLPSSGFITQWKGHAQAPEKKDTHRRVILIKGDTNMSEEGYQLSVSRDTVRITAKSSAGFLYALSTLQQLQTDEKIPCCEISDHPAFSWRGAMIDVSRHFFPISFLKRQVDILSSFKINRLHLHLTDAAGWRMEIRRYPRLTRMAAWRTDALWKTWWNGGRKYAEQGADNAFGGYYTQAELRDLVSYASQRGITIVPEIEMPAHSEEVLTAYPELSCTHEPYKQADFCPGNIATYDFLENVLKEVMEVFPSPYIHVGGDEAGKASWSTCPLCQKKMQEEGIQDVKGLQTYLNRHFARFLKEHGRQLVGWDEIIDEQLPQGTHVMVWRDIQSARTAADYGYDVILSPGSHCYLDAYQDAPNTQPEAIGGFLTLEKVYSFQPTLGMTEVQKQHVKGIQGNLWTEYVPTEAHAEHMLYPRMLALAEVAWNGTPKKDYADFRRRALLVNDQLRHNGISAFNLHQEIGDRPAASRPVHHKAVGAKVIYNRPVNPYYPGKGETTLTDGRFGGWNHGDGCWQGFIGKNCFDVTLDLGRSQTVREIQTDFLQYSSPEIFYPGTYRIEVSQDGVNFSELYSLQHEVSHSPAVDSEFWGWKGKTKTRYVRIQASSGKLGGWLFADEVIIR